MEANLDGDGWLRHLQSLDWDSMAIGMDLLHVSQDLTSVDFVNCDLVNLYLC